MKAVGYKIPGALEREDFRLRPSCFHRWSAVLAALFCAVACGTPSATPQTAEEESEASFELVLASEVEWNHLNPARGDKAPQAATLWGDRNGSGPTGFLLRPADGFSSPPHIHNVSTAVWS